MITKTFPLRGRVWMLAFALMLITGALSWAPGLANSIAQQDSGAVVHAILFWMDGCPHCHFVLDEVLPPLEKQYGSQLDLLKVEVSSAEDYNVLLNIAEDFGRAKETVGVPLLVIGDRIMIGKREIPEMLPQLIKEHLSQGGVDFPQSQALRDYLSGRDIALPVSDPVETAEPSAAQEPILVQEEPRSNGFSIAGVVMVGMILALVYAFARLFIALGSDIRPLAIPGWQELAVPALVVIGAGIAFYLAYVETQEVAAVCGPVGDCNSVQSSSYAKLFGVLPVAVLGLLGYLGVITAWLVGKYNFLGLRKYAHPGFFGMALFGTIFSLYLTYLEIFVIKAVCMWCVTTAVIMTALMLLSLRPTLNSLAEDENISE